MAQEDPGRVVCLVQPDGPAEICNGLIMVSSKAVEVACTVAIMESHFGVWWRAK